MHFYTGKHVNSVRNVRVLLRPSMDTCCGHDEGSSGRMNDMDIWWYWLDGSSNLVVQYIYPSIYLSSLYLCSPMYLLINLLYAMKSQAIMHSEPAPPMLLCTLFSWKLLKMPGSKWLN